MWSHFQEENTKDEEKVTEGNSSMCLLQNRHCSPLFAHLTPLAVTTDPVLLKTDSGSIEII